MAEDYIGVKTLPACWRWKRYEKQGGITGISGAGFYGKSAAIKEIKGGLEKGRAILKLQSLWGRNAKGPRGDIKIRGKGSN